MKVIASSLIVCCIITFATVAHAGEICDHDGCGADGASLAEDHATVYAHRRLLILGSVLAGVGAGAAVGGGFLAAAGFAAGNAPDGYDAFFAGWFGVTGIAYAVAGAAALVSGVILITTGSQAAGLRATAQDAKPAVSLVPTLQPLPGGAAFGLAGTLAP